MGADEGKMMKRKGQTKRESTQGHLFYALKACFNLWIGFELNWKHPGSDWTINNPHWSRYKCWRSSMPEILSISFSSAVNPRRWLMGLVSCCHSYTTLAECKQEDYHAWMNACELQMWICECSARTYSILSCTDCSIRAPWYARASCDLTGRPYIMLLCHCNATPLKRRGRGGLVVLGGDNQAVRPLRLE